MRKYFELIIEFDRNKVKKIIDCSIRENTSGYVCVIDGNVLANATKHKEYRNIINNALVNTCDGISIAFFASKIYNKKFSTYTGPELFKDYLKKTKLKQCFVGNTKKVHMQLVNRFNDLGFNSNNFQFLELPFKDVDRFNYSDIAKKINKFSPDIIWISLGAPKQEKFIFKLNPYLDKGILIGIGAAFNLYLSNSSILRAPKWLRKLNLEWLYRVIMEPRRVGLRAFKYLILIPKIIYLEIHK